MPMRGPGWLLGVFCVVFAAMLRAAVPVPVILDTDLASDVDDVGDLAVLNALANTGEAKILAVVTDSANAYSAPAAKALLTYFGKGTVPVGAYQGTVPAGAGAGSVYTRTITNEFGPAGDVRSNYPDAVGVYRRALAAADDGSVTVVATGFFEPLSGLLQSGADGVSNLTGIELVARKVKRLVVAAGFYPTSNGKAEFNFQQDPAAASRVFADWPTEIVCVGIELGNTVFTGPSVQDDSTSNPLKRAYNLWGSSTRQAWGQLALLYAVRGLSDNFRVLGADGTNAVDPTTGNNTWSPSPNRQQSYLGKTASDAALEHILNDLLGAGPAGHPDFFCGEAPLSNGTYYLGLPISTPFGCYTYLADARYLYHFDLGYEYWFDAADHRGGIYLYDFRSGDYFYTSPTFPFPYLYDFSLDTVLYYYPDTNGTRCFFDFNAGQVIVK